VTNPTNSHATHNGVSARLRRLVISMLALLAFVGVAGVIAVEVATGQVGTLAKGYTPANDAHTAALTLMLDAETSIRGYLITGNRTFLQPYQSSFNQVLPTLDRAQSALDSVGAHGQDQAIAVERDRASQWLTSYATRVAAGSGGPASVSTALQNMGKQLFDEYRQANTVVTNVLNDRRAQLREESRRLRGLAIPSLMIAVVLAVLIAAGLALRAAASISSPLSKLWSVVRRLDDGDLSARADEEQGPAEVQALARAVNALGTRARVEAAAERDAEQFRQRTRLISATIRRTTSGVHMAEHLVRGLGQAFEVDRVWLHTFADERVPRLTAQWHSDKLAPFPDALEKQVEAARSLANRLWTGAHVITIDDHRTYEPSIAGQSPFKIAQAAGTSASIVVPIGDSASAFGLLWVAMAGHPRHWTTTEAGVAQHLAADLAHSLVQAHVIERQAQAVQLLRELDQAKADFISTVSHELRTPLTSISGYLEMLQDGDGGTLPDNAARMLAIIDRNATRLRNLIEDLLTQSRIDAGRLRLDVTQVDVGAVLGAVYAAMTPLASSSDISLDLTAAPGANLVIEADPQQLEQVFTNLVSNAIKFTPAGGKIAATAEADDAGDGILVQVSDSGIGIPDHDFENLFTRFFRASNASAAALPGTGLGLAIVQEIVHRHGGAVDVDSQIGAGTTFTVWLPRQPPRELAL
jgi:two-component system phosphate regulon sensor histidine kinase PhoR